MCPDDRDFDEEVQRGEHTDARRAALGDMPAVRDSMRRVWYSRWLDAVTPLGRDMRLALRSLMRAKGLSATVVITLALGIGANAAIFSVVRGVLLRPLVNRGEDRIVYIRQSAPGNGVANTTFSMPEIADFKARATTIAAFGDFSTIDFNVVGFGGPRVVHAGVVNGSYFDVMGLRPVLGRLLTPADDGPHAAGAVVLTHRFWTSALSSDPSVIGKTVRLGPQSAMVVGVLEPSVPYPADTEIIANVVTSPHHLGATMVTDRGHRMTDLFGRLAPDASVEDARAELIAVHAAMVREHPDDYSKRSNVQLSVTPLRDQIAAPARTILLLLLAGAAVVFVIACSNVANLILARSVRREGELATRAALGASRGALRRTLLAESLLLCGAGALLGVALAEPFVAVVSRFAARFSVRALEVTVDASVLWVGAALAMAAALLLAWVPRLPSAQNPRGFGLAGGSLRITPGTRRRLRLFATVQIAFSFLLLAGAATLLGALVALQTASTGYDMRQVIAIDVPTYLGLADAAEIELHQEMTRRIGQLPGVEGVALGNFVPWRDAGRMRLGFPFMAEGYALAGDEEPPLGRLRAVAPGFFAVLGIPMLAGRDFNDADRADSGPVAIVSESVARRMFPDGEALDRKLWWLFRAREPLRIVGVVADVDDENVVRGPALTIYRPMRQWRLAGRLFVHAAGDPYALVPAVTRIVRFGVRLAIGCSPRRLLLRVLGEGALIGSIGIVAGAAGGYAFMSVASSYLGNLRVPGPLPLFGAATVLVGSAVAASLMPAARASRVDVMEVLRSE